MSSLLSQRAPPRCDSPMHTSSQRANVARPFTASAARSSSLLTVHVHFGEHLDALVVDAAAATTSALSSFVVASIDETAGDCIECWSSSAAALRTSLPAASSITNSIDANATGRENDPGVLYTQRYSPFAATRIVERCSVPMWNELLALALPFEWRTTTDDAQHARRLALKLELVARGASQQEDFLLATALIPLQHIACHRQQMRLALQFPVALTPTRSPSTTTNHTPCVYVSLYEAARDCETVAASLTDHLEVLVERFVPITSTSDAAPPRMYEALTLAVMSLSLQSSVLPMQGPHERLEQLFTSVGHQHTQATAPLDATTSVTPISQHQLSDGNDRNGSVASVANAFAWHFPLEFELATTAAAEESEAVVPRALELTLFDTLEERRAHVRVGVGQCTLPPHLRVSGDDAGARTLHTDTSFVSIAPVPVYSSSLAITPALPTQPTFLGHVHVRVRWWSPAAWTAFVRAAPSRRVVSSNRSVGQSSALRALAWTGALQRGIHRYPVSSFCDDGGLSSVLVSFLAASSTRTAPAPTSANAGGDAAVNAVLAAQLTHMQTESAAQRQQIEHLQTELDARLRAVQTCGKELVALRREVRTKQQQIDELHAERDRTAASERKQIAQLTAAARTSAPRTNALASHTHEQLALVLAKYADLETQYRSTCTQLESANRALEHARGVETRYSELEHAHLVQAAHVQRLQRDKQLVSELKRTVRLQERVIQQFETAVRLEAVAADDERSRDRSPRQHSNAAASDAHHNSDSDKRILNRTTECSDALLAVRVRVLEEQLHINARAAASEISRLKLRVLELEAAASNSKSK